MNTYLIYDLGDTLALIDQHAAHERVRYERLKSRFESGAPPTKQDLLLPEVIPLRPEHRLQVAASVPLLESLGFELELFGDQSVLFRAVPSDWGSSPLRLRNLIERVVEPEGVSSGAALDPASLLTDETLFEKLASEACLSAVRAGDPLHRDEALALVRSWMACNNPWNCPHGRPTVVRIPRARVEEWFQRRAPHATALSEGPFAL